MLSLIVALDSSSSPGGTLRYALARDAATGLQAPYAGIAADGVLPEHGSAAMALLPRSTELVLVVPAQRLSWHRIVLPRVNSARLRAALDGLLEDRLLDDPAALHFALAPGAAAGEPAWVAACDKAWLQQALRAFEAAGRPVSRVVPDFVPAREGEAPTLHAVGDGEQPVLVRCAIDGVQCLPLTAASCAALGLQHGLHPSARAAGFDAIEGMDAPGYALFADPPVAVQAEALLGSAPQLVQGAQRLLAAARSGWDLAQFDLQSTGRTRLVRRAGMAWAQWMGSAEWRPARWALAVLLLAHLAGLNAWAWKERSALAAKRTEVTQLMRTTFPKVPVIVDAPVQMEREVAALRQSSGALSGRDFEPMLAAVAAGGGTRPGAPPSALEYSKGELILKDYQLPAGESAGALGAAGYAGQPDGGGLRVKPVSVEVRP